VEGGRFHRGGLSVPAGRAMMIPLLRLHSNWSGHSARNRLTCLLPLLAACSFSAPTYGEYAQARPDAGASGASEAGSSGESGSASGGTIGVDGGAAGSRATGGEDEAGGAAGGGGGGLGASGGFAGVSATGLRCSDHPLTAKTTWVATASSYFIGNTQELPMLAIDGNPTTRWSSGQDQAGGEWL
jgi:hypothetical protein